MEKKTWRFYDIKERRKIEVKVISKEAITKNGIEQYVLKAKTEDGRPLTSFVSKDDFESFNFDDKTKEM